jgi:hypothetical protein
MKNSLHVSLLHSYILSGAGIAQSVYRLATDLATYGSEFQLLAQEFSLLTLFIPGLGPV